MINIDPIKYGLEKTKAKEISEMFKPMLDKMVKLEEEYNSVIKLDISPETCAKAKEVRLMYVKVRTGTSAIHKDLKSFYLNGGRFVDGWKNAQVFASEGIEEKLKSIEDHYERIEFDRKEKLHEDRVDKLIQFDVDTEFTDFRGMTDDVWKNYYNGVKLDHDQRVAAEKKAEEDRIATELAEKKEQERIRKENETLRAEAEVKEKALAIERAKVEAERKATELKAQKEREVIEAKAKIEREAREKAESILREKQLAEEKAIKEATENNRQAELAPDKDKLSKLADTIDNLDLPELSTKESKEITKDVKILLEKTTKFIREKSSKL